MRGRQMDGRKISGDLLLFFFQAEDGMRDLTVTGVQTCALPILSSSLVSSSDFSAASTDSLSRPSILAVSSCFIARCNAAVSGFEFTLSLAKSERDRKSVV